MLTHLHRYKEGIYSYTAMIRLIFCPRGNLTSTPGCGGKGGGTNRPWVLGTLISEEAKLKTSDKEHRELKILLFLFKRVTHLYSAYRKTQGLFVPTPPK